LVKIAGRFIFSQGHCLSLRLPLAAGQMIAADAFFFAIRRYCFFAGHFLRCRRHFITSSLFIFVFIFRFDMLLLYFAVIFIATIISPPLILLLLFH